MDTTSFEKRYLLAVLLNTQCCGGKEYLINQAKNDPHRAVECEVQHKPGSLVSTLIIVLVGVLFALGYIIVQWTTYQKLGISLVLVSALFGFFAPIFVFWPIELVLTKRAHPPSQSEEILRQVSDISRLVRTYPDVVNEASASIQVGHDRLNLLSQHIDRILTEAQQHRSN